MTAPSLARAYGNDMNVDWLTGVEHVTLWVLPTLVILVALVLLGRRLLAIFNVFIAVPARNCYLRTLGTTDRGGRHRPEIIFA